MASVPMACLQLAQLCSIARTRERREQPGTQPCPNFSTHSGISERLLSSSITATPEATAKRPGLAQRLHGALVKAVKRVVANEQFRLIQKRLEHHELATLTRAQFSIESPATMPHVQLIDQGVFEPIPGAKNQRPGYPTRRLV